MGAHWSRITRNEPWPGSSAVIFTFAFMRSDVSSLYAGAYVRTPGSRPSGEPFL